MSYAMFSRHDSLLHETVFIQMDKANQSTRRQNTPSESVIRSQGNQLQNAPQHLNNR